MCEFDIGQCPLLHSTALYCILSSSSTSSHRRTSALQGGTKFTREELRDLFQLNEATDCNTRDLLAQLPGGADWQVCHAEYLPPHCTWKNVAFVPAVQALLMSWRLAYMTETGWSTAGFVVCRWMARAAQTRSTFKPSQRRPLSASCTWPPSLALRRQALQELQRPRPLAAHCSRSAQHVTAEYIMHFAAGHTCYICLSISRSLNLNCNDYCTN